MRPRERDADDGDREQHCGDEVTERQPPAGEHQPDHVADQAERPRARILLPVIIRARHRLLAEGQESIERDVAGRSRPGDADDRHRHDDGRHQPADRHPQAAADDPGHVQQHSND